jgi:hypothetical protein
MAMDFHDILSGVSLWRLHQNNEDFVNGSPLLRVDDLSIIEMMGNQIGMVFLRLK